MIRTIDKHQGVLIQKITDAKGNTLKYQVIAESSIGDGSKSQQYPTLSLARQMGGWPVKAPINA